jgi:hypothetical protein
VILIAIIDVKTGFDEEAYNDLESLTPEDGVTPLLIGRIFEESDIFLLLHSETLDSVDDYLIEHVRKSIAAQELIVIPIYKFTLLPSFYSMSEYSDDSPVNIYYETGEMDIASYPEEEMLMIMIQIDVAPTMDKQVNKTISNINGGDKIIPLMAGHTFHSKEFDIVMFFLAENLEAAWEFAKQIRTIDGVWDTSMGIIAHFESYVPLDRFREYSER